MADDFSAEYFEARIAELQEQINGALAAFDGNETFQAHNDLAQALWTAKEEKDAAHEAVGKTKTKEEKQAAQQLEKELREAFESLRTSSWPDRMDQADAFFAEIEPTLKELENAIMECAILIRSEPARLAEWCAEKEKHQEMWKAFMEDKDFQKKMIVNGGAALGKYYKSLEIHGDITKDFDKDAPNEVFDKIALAVALELAEPVGIFKHENEQFVDPYERFWHYANAHTHNQLDKHFAGLTVWEMRNVVNSNATNEDSTWCKLLSIAWAHKQ